MQRVSLEHPDTNWRRTERRGDTAKLPSETGRNHTSFLGSRHEPLPTAPIVVRHKTAAVKHHRNSYPRRFSLSAQPFAMSRGALSVSSAPSAPSRGLGFVSARHGVESYDSTQ